MSLLNRPERSTNLYDSDGFLISGWRTVEDLARALAGPPPEEDENSGVYSEQLPPSPGLTATKSPYSTSPGGYSFPSSTSGISTPSGRESLDEESGGVLTKSEANALREIIELANRNSEAEPEGPADQELKAREETSTEEVEDDDEGKSDLTETERRRTSTISNGTFESDLPATPSIYSTSSRQLPPTPLAPGPLLKTRFMEHGVIKTMLVCDVRLPESLRDQLMRMRSATPPGPLLLLSMEQLLAQRRLRHRPADLPRTHRPRTRSTTRAVPFPRRPSLRATSRWTEAKRRSSVSASNELVSMCRS